MKNLLLQIENLTHKKAVGFHADFVLDELERIEKKHVVTKEDYFRFLDLTARKEFLTKFTTTEKRTEWAEKIFSILQQTDYGLNEMFEQRVTEHPDKTLFINLTEGRKEHFSYLQIFNYTQEIAATFYAIKKEPRVAVFSANSVDSATVDLACLMYGIYDTPLNIHFSEEILANILNPLKINIVVADTLDRVLHLKRVKEQYHLDFELLISQDIEEDGTEILQEKAKELNYKEVDAILQKRPHRKLNEVATTMFTSGSTGIPKGVSFSYYNIISKRFARHAALPETGNETMLCFLPLFHTFGRYLELMGSIYWHGTYVFVGNTSSDTLLKLFPEMNPTGFISVPIRWLQLYEKAMERLNNITNDNLRLEILHKEIIGINLRWGLSAAGYLSPKIFRFFQSNGVDLCSGFGMTEATGGITMTPPGEYEDNSTGKPLPGVYTRLKENGELEISGHYIARYLDEAPPGSSIPYPSKNPAKNYWLPTGDIFTISADGHHEIVDRVKDIYKNNKGQTIAPRTIEQKFNGVPGVKLAFLVGDARPYNVLLIVPDRNDTVVKSQSGKESLRKYFHQIVQTANNDVAPYERVVNFSVLERDFSEGKKEITPKGSFNRKNIEKNFAETIKKLYQSDKISFQVGDMEVQIPRWFYRDLGILEDDIYYETNYFIKKSSGKKLYFKTVSKERCVIGDFSYLIKSKELNLGRLALQPLLWMGNAQFIEFSPVKEGWDLPLKEFSAQVCYPSCISTIIKKRNIAIIPTISNNLIVFINGLITDALFTEGEKQIQSIKLLGEQLAETQRRLALVIRRRLEALACHRIHKIRALAYQSLLIYDPNTDYQEVLPVFIQSGKTFLDTKTIEAIAESSLGKQQLASFRKRLFAYRENMEWPVKGTTRKQFEDILKLLFNFGKQHPYYYKSIRAEFAAWALHKNDDHLSELAKKYFHELYLVFDTEMQTLRNHLPDNFWDNIIVFEYGIPANQKRRLRKIITDTVFLEESIHLIFGQTTFTADKIIPEGLWITKLQSFSDFRHYRLTVNSINNKHYDLHLVVTRNETHKDSGADLYWNAYLSDYPFDMPVLSSLGISNAEHGVRSSQYLGGLRVWEKIRQMSEIHQWAGNSQPYAWHQLFIKSFAVIFRTWKISQHKIIPGAISPRNIMVPELDFKESAVIISLTGYGLYDNIQSLLMPMIKNFYQKTIALYPWGSTHLKFNWIYKAMIESLGKEETFDLLEDWRNFLINTPDEYLKSLHLVATIDEFIKEQKSNHYYPLKIHSAISHFGHWLKLNPDATKEAREQTLYEIFDLFKIFKHNEMDRFYFHRHTYFNHSGQTVKKAFDKLLQKMEERPETETIQLIELSDLQATLSDATDRRIFSKMVFPKMKHYQEMDFVKVVDKNKEQIIVQTLIKDKSGLVYTMREPRDAAEVGKLYQLFYEENYPKTVSQMDKYFVVIDKYERVIGGISYRTLENNIVRLDGTAVTSPLQGKGIGSAMINYFFTRMAAKDVAIIKAHYLLGNYFLKHNFKVDKKWGALVKHLD
jgi:long-subunit acyl-CoA synthetase (AMP-forming)/predicted GNAT family acetyltransferase